MKVIPPITITTANLISSTVAVPSGTDPAVWSGATSYSVGNTVYVAGTTNKIYECLVDVTGGDSPEVSVTRIKPKWLELRAVNRWAMFDLLRNSATTATTSLTTIFKTNTSVNAMAILGLSAVTNITVTGYAVNTNLITFPEAFDNAAWTKTNSGITANATTAPDGASTADKLTETAVTNTFSIKQTFTNVSNTVYTFSVFLKAAERSAARITLQDSGGTNNVYLDINLTTGLLGGTGSTGSLTLISYNIESIGSGWYRASVTCKSTLTLYACIYIQNPLNTTNYAGSAGSGIYVWGALVEADNAPRAYSDTFKGIEVYSFNPERSNITDWWAFYFTAFSSLSTRNTLRWYDYFFGSFGTKPAVVLFDLPNQYSNLIIKIDAIGTGTIGIGAVAVGTYKYIGSTQLGASADALNFSSVERDTYGNATLVPRRSVPKTNQKLFIDKSKLSDVMAIKTTLDAVPAVWVGIDDSNNDYFNALLILGFYRSFTFEINNPIGPMINLELEEV